MRNNNGLHGNITLREKEILQLIVQEFSTAEIAKELFLSSETIKSHRSKIMRKLQVKNVAGIVRETLMRNLLPHYARTA